MTKHGLCPKSLGMIREIFRPYRERIERVALFGSRAQGTYQSFSDLDLVVYGDIDPELERRLHTLFDDSSLPMRVDVKAYALIDFPALKRHIDEAGLLLFSKQDLEGGV